MGLALQSLIRAQPESSAVVNICASTSPLASPALFHFVMRMYISHEEVCWGHSLLVLGRVKSAASKSLMAAGVVGGRSMRAATLTVASWDVAVLVRRDGYRPVFWCGTDDGIFFYPRAWNSSSRGFELKTLGVPPKSSNQARGPLAKLISPLWSDSRYGRARKL